MIALLAQIQNNAKDVKDIFGKIDVKTGPTVLYNQPAAESIATIFVFGIRIAFVVAGLLVLIYMLWGAFDIITSGGEPEKTSMARGKMVNAIIGIIVLIVVFTIWVFITDVLGIIEKTDSGFRFNLPTLENSAGGSGGGGGGGNAPDPCDAPPGRTPRPC